MPPAIVLEIILEGLKFANKVIDGIPENVRREQSQQIWDDWKKFLAFIEGAKN